jgi:hypothetical protein
VGECKELVDGMGRNGSFSGPCGSAGGVEFCLGLGVHLIPIGWSKGDDGKGQCLKKNGVISG